ncbi:hypothetical protein CCE28_11370 [Anaeromicrobium sediminis]|uniref:Alkyl hydroperoxide reductase subunit C/ Thiol specific antioxidant domain-containing protein n=1 Tax=Anaeromicrobium sediminis TaxID=1478221 RepID=A0A267MJZ6_9FIRM|nr:hypothetical protein CCE28_11370 [Anaeromicrobium sediminis]
MYNPYLYSMNQDIYTNSINAHDSHVPTKDKKYYRAFNLGDPAPGFTLQGIVNGQPKMVSLSDYKRKWVVVFFYGSDFTFV